MSSCQSTLLYVSVAVFAALVFCTFLLWKLPFSFFKKAVLLPDTTRINLMSYTCSVHFLQKGNTAKDEKTALWQWKSELGGCGGQGVDRGTDRGSGQPSSTPRPAGACRGSEASAEKEAEPPRVIVSDELMSHKCERTLAHTRILLWAESAFVSTAFQTCSLIQWMNHWADQRLWSTKITVFTRCWVSHMTLKWLPALSYWVSAITLINISITCFGFNEHTYIHRCNFVFVIWEGKSSPSASVTNHTQQALTTKPTAKKWLEFVSLL